MQSRLLPTLFLLLLSNYTCNSTTIKWTPGISGALDGHETAATAPRSQKYWDENNIERPDYAKTDTEILQEQQQKLTAELLKLLCILLFPLTIILAVGYYTEKSIPQANNQHRRNFGQFKSKYIWDQTREPHSTFLTLLHAIFYELQPFRLSSVLEYPWKSKSRILFKTSRQYSILLWTIVLFLVHKAKLAGIYISKNWGYKQYWYFIVLPIVYFTSLDYLHRYFDAGPIMVIVTMLVLIFSIGLSDNDNKNSSGYTSAYSVFNRGFQTLLGNVDVESLVAQHVGGGGMLAFQAQQHQPQNQHRRHEHQINHLEPELREGQNAAAGEGEEAEVQAQAQAQPQNTSRKSGKKARRRNLEERRDRQRQRERARELGFVEGNDHVFEDQENMQWEDENDFDIQEEDNVN